jgi:uncharacterized protein with NRDE domain
VNGRRVEKYEDTAGAFWKQDGIWYGVTPNGHLTNLANHKVVEHEDGTITVSPSILVGKGVKAGKIDEQLWHGYLEQGVWRSV